MSMGLFELPDDRRDELESLLAEFEERWDENQLDDYQASRLPSLEPELSRIALVEMIKIDLERQWRSDHRPDVAGYLVRFPELGTPETVPVELIQVELEMREEFDERLDDLQLAARFPGRVEEIGAADVGVGANAGSVPLRFKPVKQVDLPEVFGRYRVRQQIGDGSMGDVWLAYDEELRREVALKVPKPQTDDESGELVERFYREARAVAKLDHPKICKVFDVGEIDGIHFSTMQFIKGRTLSECIGGSPLSEREVATVGHKLALALRHAHNRGVIHRDLKPRNVMIDEKGQPIVIDFGLARQLDHSGSKDTQLGVPIGTLAYMSPEQVSGNHGLVGPASDIYSLGVTLYELLTARLPYQGTYNTVNWQILDPKYQPPPPSQFRESLDPRLESICLKAMSKPVDERYTSMDEVAAELKAVLQRRPVIERPPALRATRLTGATRSVSLRRQMDCPHCWHTFSPNEMMWITAHPELRGDSLLGEDAQQRFVPSRFNADCHAIDVKGVVCRKLACPNCHLGLSRAMKLRQRLASEFRLSFADADPEANQILSDYEEALFLNSQDDKLVALRKTEKEGDLYESVRFGERTMWYPRPFVFAVQPRPDHPENRRLRRLSRAVCLYDNAGEHFLPGGELPHSPATQHLTLSRALLFLFDPTQNPRFREACRGHSDDPQLEQRQWVHRQDQVLLEAAHRIRTAAGLPQNARDKRPLIVVVTKYDAWWSLAKFEPLESDWVIRSHSSGVCGLHVERLLRVSQKMRVILMKHAPELVAAAEGFSEDVTYIPVSALGRGPERDADGALGVRPQDINPMWAEVPMLYALHRTVPGLVAKIIPRGNGHTAVATQETAS